MFVYKVTESSRGKPYERRIEITSTYPKGLRKRRDFQDVVLGYENTRAIFVGVDPRRIAHGGPTGNASSFFDKEGLTWSHSDEILVKPRRVTLFPTGVEFHAFFKPGRLAEYFFNVDAIHRGSYAGRGLYSGIVPKSEISSALLTLPAQHTGGEILEIEGPQPSARKATVSNSILEAYEFGKSKPIRRAKLSPERLLEIKRRCEEIGYLGEQIVLDHERRRLRRAGKKSLAEKIRWVSQESAGEGYDILSFEPTGKKRFIEVKASIGKARTFEISENEWQTARRKGASYFIYRVTAIKTAPKVNMFCNPSDLEARGLIRKSPSGWWLTLL